MTKKSPFRVLGAGDPAPWFRQRSGSNPDFAFDTVGGRYVVLCFFGSSQPKASQEAVAAAMTATDIFDDEHACFFGVTTDPEDEKILRERYPGYRYFWDSNGLISRLYGALSEDEPVQRRRLWVVLDPTLRIMKATLFSPTSSAEVIAFVRALPPPPRFTGMDLSAPVLVLPNVFEPELCRALIDLYQANGGAESGFMRDEDGRTIMQFDDKHKRRRDFLVEDRTLIGVIQNRVTRRIAPEIAKVHQFKVTRMERYLVGCYRADDGGHFRAHRDNTTKGTAHRRFAVTVNLNSDFDGGELSFPEYGPRTYKPAPGCAVVFSCSLLHAVSKVTRGERFAFLPFLYDDAAAAIREQNNAFLGEGVGEYRR
ncbi:MAG: 2OG-Fe(II) oxygenase [Hyphomonadaceae bacterium]